MFDEGIITWIGQRASEAKRLPRVLVARGELGGKKREVILHRVAKLVANYRFATIIDVSNVVKIRKIPRNR